MTNFRDKQPWVGFDLDGTLAHTKTPTGNMNSVGRPIPEMINLLKTYLLKGIKVKIFTARANDSRQISIIQKWLKKCSLPEDIEITSIKDYGLIEFYDDRAIQVQRNTGRIIE